MRWRACAICPQAYILFAARPVGNSTFREHSFFGTLLAGSAAIADFGAHRGEFFAALKSEYSISRALLVEANPALAEP